MHIGGANFRAHSNRAKNSYYLSRYPHVWGWATWRRAWSHYDADMNVRQDANIQPENLLEFASAAEKYFWHSTWQSVREGKIDTWDYQWTFACMNQRGIAIAPSVNLVSNIGFGADATHTVEKRGKISNLALGDMVWPLVHPSQLDRDRKHDEELQRRYYSAPSLFRRALRRLRKEIIRGRR